LKTNQFFTRINFGFKQITSRRVIEDKSFFYSDDTTTLLERGYVVRYSLSTLAADGKVEKAGG